MASFESMYDNLKKCLNDAGECSERFYALLPVLGKEEVLKYCMNVGLIASNYECPKCGENMKLSERTGKNDGYNWRCKKKGVNAHDVSRSVRKGSWFEASNLDMCSILLLMRKWFGCVPQNYTQADLKVANQTTVDWYMFCREVCMEVILHSSVKLGGKGVIVEIDESKFGKRKYNRGRMVDGNWVFGGVERGTNKCFFKVVENRSKDVLLDVIKEWILPGTTIISDCWRAYDCLKDKGFQHEKVNHSLEFVDSDTGAHTNSIEGTWAAIKRLMRSNSHHTEDMFDSYLFEYIWRRKHGHSLQDSVFKQFLNDCAVVFPPETKDDMAKRKKT